MILIADSGSTKIDWCLLNGKKKVAQIFTTGMNALLMTGPTGTNVCDVAVLLCR